MRTPWLFALALAACGTDPMTSPPAPPPPMADASTDHTITLQMTPFTLQPGQEVVKCQGFANPTADDLWVKEIESHDTVGSHHLLLLTAPPGDSAETDCTNGVTADQLIIYGSQVPDSDMKFPDQVALRSKASQGLMLQSHYFNASDSVITANVEMVLHLAEPGTATIEAGVVQFANQEFTVPAGPPDTTVTKTCTVPHAMNVLRANSHMHRHGVGFQAMTGSTMLYETTSWSEPMPRAFEPAMALDQGAQVTWSCTYHNDTGSTIPYGPSADTNEMCNFSTIVYPMPYLTAGSFLCY